MERKKSTRSETRMARLLRRSAMAFFLAVLTLSVTAGATPALPCTRLVTAALESLNQIQYAEAEELYRQAAEGPACRLDALLGLAEVGNRTGKRRDAQRAASEVLAATSDPVLLAEAHFQLGNSAYRRGSGWNRNRREAETAFLRAITVSEGRHLRAVSRLKLLYDNVGEQEKLAELERQYPEAAVLTREETRALAYGSSPWLDHEPTDATTDGLIGCRAAEDGRPLEDIRAPERVYDPQAEYTPNTRAMKIQGIVALGCCIDKNGQVENVTVLKSLHPELDEAAVAALRRWRFRPARTSDGEPVAVRYNVTVNFRLE